MTLTQINKAGLDELALDHVFTIGASGSSAYTFQGEGLNGTVNNPTLYLTRGKTYRFENGSGGHPIRIQSTSGASGTAYNTGVTNNAGSGTVIVEVQHDAPDVLYYQCTSHAAMNGILYITGALADGGVTTAKIAADAVTGAKLADPSRVVVAFMGDGGLEMVLGELITLRDLALPVIVIVFVDASLALIEKKQREMQYKNAGVDMNETDFKSIALATGGNGFVVQTRTQLTDALNIALNTSEKFTLISCKIPRGSYDEII